MKKIEPLRKQPFKVIKVRDYVLVYSNQQESRDIKPEREILNQISLEPGGIIFTAKDDRVLISGTAVIYSSGHVFLPE